MKPLFETSGIENLKRAERKARAIIALVLICCGVFVVGLFALVVFGHARAALIGLVSAYVVGFIFLIWEARQAPDLTCAGTVDGNCQRPPSKTGAGHSVCGVDDSDSRHASRLETYWALDLLTEDFKANGWDTKGILAAKSDLAKRIFNYKAL